MQVLVKNSNFRPALFFSSERSANSLPTCADGSTTLVLASYVQQTRITVYNDSGWIVANQQTIHYMCQSFNEKSDMPTLILKKKSAVQKLAFLTDFCILRPPVYLL